MNILINQPAGIGDILFIQKIVRELEKDNSVFLPVKESISWLVDYLPTVCLRGDLKDVAFDEIKELDGSLLPNCKIMESKYKLVGIDFKDYIDYIHIERNRGKENSLYNTVYTGKPYRLVCPWYGTPQRGISGMLKKDIPTSDVLSNIVMNIMEGYTLFDWLKVIENAEEIYTTDSAIMFLIEKYDCKAQSLVAYSRRRDSSEIDYLFKKPWVYVTHD